MALDAARANVPTAARVFLCDGWPDTASAFPKKGKPKKYEWIVSNPPVHRGQPDDFVALIELIGGARRRLRKGGVLWLVAQEQVPVGRLLELHGGFQAFGMAGRVSRPKLALRIVQSPENDSFGNEPA